MSLLGCGDTVMSDDDDDDEEEEEAGVAATVPGVLALLPPTLEVPSSIHHDIPEEFVCPITLEVMTDPVIAGTLRRLVYICSISLPFHMIITL